MKPLMTMQCEKLEKMFGADAYHPRYNRYGACVRPVSGTKKVMEFNERNNKPLMYSVYGVCYPGCDESELHATADSAESAIAAWLAAK